MSKCPDCAHPLSNPGKCRCGWILITKQPVMPEKFRPHYPSWQESKSAYEKVKGRFAVALKPKVWTREEFIAHYETIASNLRAPNYAVQHAIEALAKLDHKPKPQRQPGEDDDLGLGIPSDDLELAGQA